MEEQTDVPVRTGDDALEGVFGGEPREDQRWGGVGGVPDERLLRAKFVSKRSEDRYPMQKSYETPSQLRAVRRMRSGTASKGEIPPGPKTRKVERIRRLMPEDLAEAGLVQQADLSRSGDLRHDGHRQARKASAIKAPPRAKDSSAAKESARGRGRRLIEHLTRSMERLADKLVQTQTHNTELLAEVRLSDGHYDEAVAIAQKALDERDIAMNRVQVLLEDRAEMTRELNEQASFLGMTREALAVTKDDLVWTQEALMESERELAFERARLAYHRPLSERIRAIFAP